jgi:hypothetical protein
MTSLHRKWLFSLSLLQHHYIESLFLVDHYYDTFDVPILPMASKKITKSKIKNIFLSNYQWLLPMVTKACGALGG